MQEPIPTDKPFQLCHCLVVVNCLDYRPLCALVKVVHGLHVLCINLKVVDVGILHNPARRVALGQRNPVLLQAVSDEYLAGRLVVLLRQRHERLVLCLLVANNGAVRLDNNTLLLAV